MAIKILSHLFIDNIAFQKPTFAKQSERNQISNLFDFNNDYTLKSNNPWIVINLLSVFKVFTIDIPFLTSDNSLSISLTNYNPAVFWPLREPSFCVNLVSHQSETQTGKCENGGAEGAFLVIARNNTHSANIQIKNVFVYGKFIKKGSKLFKKTKYFIITYYNLPLFFIQDESILNAAYQKPTWFKKYSSQSLGEFWATDGWVLLNDASTATIKNPWICIDLLNSYKVEYMTFVSGKVLLILIQ